MYHREGFERLLAGLDRAALGDRRRNRRARRIATQMVNAPAASLPTMLEDRHQAKRAYAWFGHPMVMPQALLEGVCAEVAATIAQRPRTLLVGDDACLDLSTHRATRGLGPVGNHRGRGLALHGLLAVDGEDFRVLGLADLQHWTRPEHPVRAARGVESTYARAARARESEVWLRGVARVAARVAAARGGVLDAGPAPRLISVGDCGADIFGHQQGCLARGQGFVLRAHHDRALCTTDGGARAEHLHAAAAQGTERGRWTTTVRDRRGGQRAATLSVRTCAVTLRPPQTLPTDTPPLTVHVVHCREIAPPADQTPAAWLLLTSEPVTEWSEVVWVLRAYEARWLIEEWHMALKTGCRVEARQFESRHAVENFLALAAPIAVCMLQLRDEARRPHARAASVVMPPHEWDALRALRPRLPAAVDASTALREIGRLGGHAGSNQTQAGWRTLWRGFEKVWLAARALREHAKSELPRHRMRSGE